MKFILSELCNYYSILYSSTDVTPNIEEKDDKEDIIEDAFNMFLMHLVVLFG